MKIGVDVDICVVDTGEEWEKWLLSSCNSYTEQYVKDKQVGVLEYDLSKYFIMPYGTDAYDFWRSPSLYQPLTPIENSTEVLLELSKKHEIIFVSAIKGLHASSKFYWIKKHFPFLKGCLFTFEKHYVDVDIMIDDRIKNLNKFSDKTSCIQINTIYTQDENHKRKIHVAENWLEIKNIVEALDGNV